MRLHGKFGKSALRKSAGVALIAALLLLLLLSAAAVALMYSVNTEQHLEGTDQANGMAYYGAEAGMEKMMADVASLYNGTTAPTATQIAAVACPSMTSCANYPTPSALNGTTISEYNINVPLDNLGNPAYTQSTISSGNNQGLIAEKLSLGLAVTAGRLQGSAANPVEQVRLLRNVEVALIPVFQFGVFSDSDLSYFAGPQFAFGGRVHTNKNLFLAEGKGADLIFQSPVHAVYDIVRDTLANGVGVGSATDGGANGHVGDVYMPTGLNGCAGFAPPAAPPPTCVKLTYTAPDQGSSQGGTIQHTVSGVLDPLRPSDGGGANGGWVGISKGTYNLNVLGGATASGVTPTNGNGPSPLNLPFVQPGVSQIEIIRRPQPTDNVLTANSRLYNKAQVRVLLSDTAAELPAGSRPLFNSVGNPSANKFAEPDTTTPDPGQTGIGFVPTDGSNTSLIGGYVSVEVRDAAGNYSSVTDTWLAKGVARDQAIPDSEHGVANTYNANAILLVEQTDDTHTTLGTQPSTPKDYTPINLYDVREGNMRDIDDGNCRIGGVLNVVDIDVKNLKTWLAATPAVENTSQNGYVLYFSDRRGTVKNPKTGVNVGEYGFTDVINEANSNGSPNGNLDEGELPDPGQPTKPETYGQTQFTAGVGQAALGSGFGAAFSAQSPSTIITPAAAPGPPPVAGTGCTNVARKNWVAGPRHAVRLINGSLGNLPLRPNADPNNTGGFTLASENPAYVIGNYNANDAGFGDPHASAAVIGDTVTLLSKKWTDKESFSFPTTPSPGRQAQTSSYRLAIASGKNQNFTHANVANLPSGAAPSNDFGTDGGVHNFLRFLETWGGQTVNYRGSLVSLYYSQYATGVFKCCTTVYSPPNRGYNFDSDFQNISEMPPGTPRFEAVINTGFRQDFAKR